MEYVTKTEIKRGCLLNPYWSSIRWTHKKTKHIKETLKLGYCKVKQIKWTELMFANDMVLLAERKEVLRYNTELLKESLMKINMHI